MREFFHLIYGTQYTHLKIFNGGDRNNMSFIFGLKVKVKDLTVDQSYVLDLNKDLTKDQIYVLDLNRR